MNEFTASLAANIKAAIKKALSDGTTGASPDCLMMMTETPSRFLDGAPEGTNAPYHYRELFLKTLSGLRPAPAPITADSAGNLLLF